MKKRFRFNIIYSIPIITITNCYTSNVTYSIQGEPNDGKRIQSVNPSSVKQAEELMQQIFKSRNQPHVSRSEKKKKENDEDK